MAEGQPPRFKGGKKSLRDAHFGMPDVDFWRWWHREGKVQHGGLDLETQRQAMQIYEQWIQLGRPVPK